jgi:thiopeptide-type bacteriocin biosynthesis protein
MELAESLFHIDSMVTLRLLDATEGEAGERLRWQFALRSIDELLDSFNYSPDRKLILLERLKEGFIEEHGAGKRLKLQLDTKFRAMRKHVDNALNRDNDTTRDFNALTELLVWKRNEVADIASKILDINASNSLQVSLDDLLSSYIHMMLNRIFKARQRTYEMVLYDLLYKHYKSTAGREKFLAKNKLIRETA